MIAVGRISKLSTDDGLYRFSRDDAVGQQFIFDTNTKMVYMLYSIRLKKVVHKEVICPLDVIDIYNEWKWHEIGPIPTELIEFINLGGKG